MSATEQAAANPSSEDPAAGEEQAPAAVYEKPKIVRVRRVLAAGGHTV